MSAKEPSVSPEAAAPAASGSPPVSIFEIFLTFLVIGATSFGGGVVAYLRNALVVSKGWLDDEQFMTALEISQALPGLNATNMSVIVGDRLRGPVGAIAGFLGMTLPGGLLVFALGVFYASNHGNPAMHSVLAGIGASSVGLLAAVTLQIGHKQLEHFTEIALVVITVVMVSFLHISLLAVLLTVLPLALFIYRPSNSDRPKITEEEAP
ncbi:chromate transporter [Xanthobacter oligotrophicus]|uniref:chromate transporter n=1 Tax=Xanthobacter oligotrophicus TaxID=2607286 RepID=UPI0011F11B07|nr:chromate transporter [Xanthobacter oligotrophicus]MCG5233933.1 chromate transporter [Xanthobacter oligotrophicus]